MPAIAASSSASPAHSAGVIAAWVITVATHSLVLISLAILIVAPFIPHHIGNRYWLHTALIALLVLLAYDLTELKTEGLNAQGMAGLLMERMKDILLGCAMALIGTVMAFPRDPSPAAACRPRNKSLREILSRMGVCACIVPCLLLLGVREAFSAKKLPADLHGL